MLDDDLFVSLDAAGCVEDTAHPYRFAAWEGLLEDLDDAAFSALVADARICNTAFLRQTYWAPSGAAPRFALERLALEIWSFHADRIRGLVEIDAGKSGAEWWVQLRDGQEGELNKKDEGDEEDVLNSSASMAFHFDKDEVLHEHTGLYVHPQVSTVTYLTTRGAPTVILEKTSLELLNGKDDGSVDSSFVSFPVRGKHAAFDGRYLHGVISDYPPPAANEATETPPQRVTLLVNVWFNYRPSGVGPFPDGLAAMMASVPALRLCRDAAPSVSVPQAGFEESASEKGPDSAASAAIGATEADVLRTLDLKFSRTGTQHLVRLPIVELPAQPQGTSFVLEYLDEKAQPYVIEEVAKVSPETKVKDLGNDGREAPDVRETKRKKVE